MGKFSGKVIACLEDENISSNLLRACLDELICDDIHHNALIDFVKRNPKIYERPEIPRSIKVMLHTIEKGPNRELLPRTFERERTAVEIVRFYRQNEDMSFYLYNNGDAAGKLYWIPPTGSQHRSSRTHVCFILNSGEIYLSIPGIAHAYSQDTDTRPFCQQYFEALDDIIQITNPEQCEMVKNRPFFTNEALVQVSKLYHRYLSR